VLFAIIVGFILYSSWPLITGKTIILETRPYDPFDLIRGNYLQIGYEIGQISYQGNLEEGDIVYVYLSEDDSGISRYKDISLIKPKSGDFIKGKVVKIRANTISVEYGIEQYFIERGTRVERGNMEVEVKVNSFGQGRIVRITKDGKQID